MICEITQIFTKEGKIININRFIVCEKVCLKIILNFFEKKLQIILEIKKLRLSLHRI